MWMVYYCSEGPYVSRWFIGLIFVKAENVNVDLTYDIQSFADTGNYTFIIIYV